MCENNTGKLLVLHSLINLPGHFLYFDAGTPRVKAVCAVEDRQDALKTQINHWYPLFQQPVVFIEYTGIEIIWKIILGPGPFSSRPNDTDGHVIFVLLKTYKYWELQ